LPAPQNKTYRTKAVYDFTLLCSVLTAYKTMTTVVLLPKKKNEADADWLAGLLRLPIAKKLLPWRMLDFLFQVQCAKDLWRMRRAIYLLCRVLTSAARTLSIGVMR
jgi:hypothetical protein